jgi:hypothetical protein
MSWAGCSKGKSRVAQSSTSTRNSRCEHKTGEETWTESQSTPQQLGPGIVKLGTFVVPTESFGQTMQSDRTPVLFVHRFRGTLDDWDPLFVDELAKTRHMRVLAHLLSGTWEHET